MRHVPPPLAELTAQAQSMTSAGDLIGARAVLTDALDPVDADPQHASPDLATAAALLARILIALGDAHAARLWAGFAHAAEDRLHGPHDERTVAVAALHAAVLHRIGNHGRAAQLYHDLVGELAGLDGPDSARVLAAEADLATAEHAAGHCTAARARLADAWARQRQRYGDAAPAGIKMLARLGAMERECGRTAESMEHLALVQELCARYLPADHPLARQAADLARASASGQHVCGRGAQSSGSGDAPGVMPVHRPAAPGVTPVGAHAGRRPVPPERQYDPDPEPDDRETDPNGTAYQQPLYLSDVHPTPGDRTGRHARADTPPEPTGQRAPEIGADDRQIRVGAAVQLPPSTRITTADRRLPVPVEKPDSRSWRPLVLVALLVAGIAVAAAVVVATLPRGAGTPKAAASVAASAPAASVPAVPASTRSAPGQSASRRSAPNRSALAGTPPQRVRLQDNRDSVSLTWTYPRGAEGPVLISGGRAGQEQRAFQQLPAGATNYVVYGLNEQSDYCFTVAVVYSVDQVAASGRLCTNRR
ncbi:MAG TPA: fibronectin type III domain-containing protein [Actinoplanes sp.]|jgi:hypothetical protein|nr:fibronectin type III domain-containing protein [Actinoplanes sp.]